MSKEKKGVLKANSDLMNELHSIIAQDLLKRIKGGDATVQEVSAAIKFLKDNDITADVEFSKPLAQLGQEAAPVGALPFIDEDDEETCGSCKEPCGNEHCVTKVAE